jgi:hypothetical protein
VPRIALAIYLLSAVVAYADGNRLDLEISKTVERDVAIATGWFCDDPTLVSAELVTRGERNVWVVRGVKVGTTQCRVGTDPSRPVFVYEVHVLPAKKPSR